jgi:hypothetical protein
MVASLSTTLGLPPETHRATLTKLQDIATTALHTEPGAVALYREVACREIVDTVPANDLDVVFEKGKLVRNRAEEGTKCQGLHVTTPYDAAQLQFEAKVYYFIGESDVATPAWQGTYHFESHRGPAIRVITKDGGHASLHFNQAPCASALMKNIGEGGAGFQALVASCPIPVDLAVR